MRVGLHQGCLLSPNLFNLLMDGTVENIKEETPWTMMFVGDIVLVDESKDGIESCNVGEVHWKKEVEG